MGKGKEHRPEIRSRVISKHKSDLSYSQIAKELDIPKPSVKSIMKAFKKTGLVRSAPRTGRPRVTTPHENCIIVPAVKQNRRLSVETLQETFAVFHDKDISLATIRQRIRETGLHGRAARKKPYLSKANKKKRLDYAMKYQHWTNDDGRRCTSRTKVRLI
ncbi:hypothetical protein DYB30_011181 [Aphanomyces astaci]|uniref:Uncharacterized protein n=1 Tax=Aphanomyces astaci TaxID=112090 RepID=A0A397CEJ4_APHAT|nr:hypothetical protein DYB30_011181 [Aphanomyces astaci]RHY90283.1 hypothetical protein DYB26_004078 [Aphanomyces astaci]